MATRITPYAQEHVEQMLQFNQRVRAGGMQSQFPAQPTSDWLPPVPGRRIFQDYYVALDDSSTVRGAYILKHQDFKLGDQVISIGDFQLPISEGAVNRTYASVATTLLLDCQRKQPLLDGLGIGGHNEAVARLVKAAGWSFATVPFFFKVIYPFQFFRKTTFLRRSAAKRLVLDMAAFSGLGCLALKICHSLKNRNLDRSQAVTVRQIDAFGPWADELWEACRNNYPYIAVRDQATLDILYPREKAKFIRLQVLDGSRLLGWAVMLDTQMTKHKHFGAMRLGSVVDALAAPQDAGAVVAAATRLLQQRGVDLVVSNFSHRDWGAGFDAAGYLRGPSNFLHATSRPLSKLLAERQIDIGDMHLNRGDGDGPINL